VVIELNGQRLTVFGFQGALLNLYNCSIVDTFSVQEVMF